MLHAQRDDFGLGFTFKMRISGDITLASMLGMMTFPTWQDADQHPTPIISMLLGGSLPDDYSSGYWVRANQSLPAVLQFSKSLFFFGILSSRNGSEIMKVNI